MDRIYVVKYDSIYSDNTRLWAMWDLIDEAERREGRYVWLPDNIVHVAEWVFTCTLCSKTMSSPYCTVCHVRGSIHQVKLRELLFDKEVAYIMANINSNDPEMDPIIQSNKKLACKCKLCPYHPVMRGVLSVLEHISSVPHKRRWRKWIRVKK